MFIAPQPRSKLYSKPSTYLYILFQALTGQLRRGSDVTFLENKLASMTGTRHAIMTPTARFGIYLALSNLIKPGQKVLLSPITIVDVINMVICAGGIPTFVDTRPNTCNIDADLIEKAIDENTGAVFITHLHGLACDVEKIKTICDRHNIPLVEDAAQAFSTRVNGTWVGSFGKAGIYSFGMYKIVNAFFGGMITTNDDGLADKLRQQIAQLPFFETKRYLNKVTFGLLTDLSTSPFFFPIVTYWIFRYGYLHNIQALTSLVTVDRNPKRVNQIPQDYLRQLLPIQARLINQQLHQVETNNRARIESARLYNRGLSTLPHITTPPFLDDGSHIYTYYAVRIPDRRKFMAFAFRDNRDLVLSHYHNCAALDIFQEFGGTCPTAQVTSQELVYLPTYPQYQHEQIDKNIETIRRYLSTL